jgi:hypothetical protein
MAWRSAGATRGLPGVPSVSHGLFDRDSDARREKPGWSLPHRAVAISTGHGVLSTSAVASAGSVAATRRLHSPWVDDGNAAVGEIGDVAGDEHAPRDCAVAAIIRSMVAASLAVEGLAGAAVRSMALNRGGECSDGNERQCDKLQWVAMLSTWHFVNGRHGGPVWLDWSRAVPNGRRRRRPVA